MRLKKYYILLVLAVALMLGHQLVPHCHCIDTEAVALSSDSHNDDLLSKIFGVDIGANHLENYTTAKNGKKIINLVIISGLFQNILGCINQQVTIHIHPAPEPSVLRHHITSFSLRPPPAV